MPACELLLAVVELGTDNEKRRLNLIAGELRDVNRVARASC
jgi:hypothetical protein